MKKHQENLQEIPVYDSSLKNETLIPVSSISLFPQINVFDGTIKRPNSAISTSTSSTKTSSIPATSCRGAESDNFNASEEQDDDVSTLIDEEINLITNKMDGIEGNVIYSIPNISTPMRFNFVYTKVLCKKIFYGVLLTFKGVRFCLIKFF